MTPTTKRRIGVAVKSAAPGDLTAENLTDEQIDACGLDDETREYAKAVDPNWLGGARHWGAVHRAARSRCAAAINARAKGDR